MTSLGTAPGHAGICQTPRRWATIPRSPGGARAARAKPKLFILVVAVSTVGGAIGGLVVFGGLLLLLDINDNLRATRAHYDRRGY